MTSQNHCCAVVQQSVENASMTITHMNLLENTAQ